MFNMKIKNYFIQLKLEQTTPTLQQIIYKYVSLLLDVDVSIQGYNFSKLLEVIDKSN